MAWGSEDGVEFDAETGELRNVIVYGEEAAVFSRRCRCGRFVTPDGTALFSERYGARARGSCSKCGPVDLEFICYRGDCE